MQHKTLTTHTVQINGTKTNYWQKNPRATDNVVLALHGFMSDLRSIQPFIDDLDITNDTRVLLPDLPGFGSSEPIAENASIDNYVDWARAFINQITPQAREITIIGYSFGAYIAIKFAAEKQNLPISKLILITPVVKIAPQVRLYSNGFDLLAALSMRAAHKLYVWPLGFDFTTYYLSKTKDKPLREKLRLYRRQELEALRPEIVLNLYRRLVDIDLVPSAAQLTMPVVIIMAEKDNVAFNYFTKNFMKNIQSSLIQQTINDAGHLLPFEEPQRLAETLNSLSIELLPQTS